MPGAVTYVRNSFPPVGRDTYLWEVVRQASYSRGCSGIVRLDKPISMLLLRFLRCLKTTEVASNLGNRCYIRRCAVRWTFLFLIALLAWSRFDDGKGSTAMRNKHMVVWRWLAEGSARMDSLVHDHHDERHGEPEHRH